MSPYQITVKFPNNNSNLREIIYNDGVIRSFYIPRNSIKYFEKRYRKYENWQGVYILLDNGIHPHRIYIGKTSKIKRRLMSHKSRTDSENWWRIEIAFTTTFDDGDHGISQGRQAFLEYYMCYRAKQLGYKLPYNKQNPQEPPINPDDKSTLEHKYFVEIARILNSIGLPIFSNKLKDKNVIKEPDHISSNHRSSFIKVYCSFPKKQAYATAMYNPQNEITVVQKGSKIASKVPHEGSIYQKEVEILKHKIMNHKPIIDSDGKFTCNYPFQTPSGAGKVIVINSINGRECWKTSSGKSIKELFGKRVGGSK